ncbi:MAG TPA: hypothetical protein VFS92_03615, partial [Planctomycetota bacterium]|nr:hypothetical protein [Planctomycetota bacterium]
VEAGVRGARVEVDVGPVGSVVVKDRFGDPVPRFRLRFAEHSTGRVSERVCDRLGVAHLPYRSAGRWRVERAVPKPGRETVLGTVEARVPGQVIALPEERE